MRLDARVFALAKDPDQPSGYQDACALDAARCVAAIADGVSSAIFSGPWASILSRAVVGDTPDPVEKGLFAAWLATQRRLWTAKIDTARLAWFQKAKLPTGAFSTLLWIRVLQAQHETAGSFGGYRLTGYAIGDSCLFQVRRGELVRSFPVQTSAELEADPMVLGSVDLGRDQLLQFATLDAFCYPEDLLILTTDALAEWALRQYELQHPPAWEDCWNLSAEDWRAEIAGLRNERLIHEDDTTLVMLRVVEEPAVTGQPTEAAAPATEGDASLDWIRSAARSVKSATETAQPADPTAERVWRGLKALKDKAVKKYREKFGKQDPPERGGG